MDDTSYIYIYIYPRGVEKLVMGCTVKALHMQCHRFETHGWDGRRNNGKIRISVNNQYMCVCVCVCSHCIVIL